MRIAWPVRETEQAEYEIWPQLVVCIIETYDLFLKID